VDIFLSRIAILSYAGWFWWSIIQVVFIVPIMFYTFFWGIYDFRPKHCKQSFLDILKNPVPGVEFEGLIGELDDFNSLWH
jgi:hypothetical protein